MTTTPRTPYRLFHGITGRSLGIAPITDEAEARAAAQNAANRIRHPVTIMLGIVTVHTVNPTEGSAPCLPIR